METENGSFEYYEQVNLEKHNSNIINRNYNLYLTF